MEKKVLFKDSGKIFLFCIIGILIASFALVNIISSSAGAQNLTSEEVYKQKWAIYLSTFLSEFAFLIAFLVVIIFKKNKKEYIGSLRIGFKFDCKIFLLVVVMATITMFCSINMTGLFNYCFSFIFPPQSSSVLNINISSFWEFLLLVFILAILPAIIEELVFRGIIYNGLRQKVSVKRSIILSAFMFMLVHMSIYTTFYQLILGGLLALLVYFTGSIFYGSIFHFVNNFIIVLIYYISPQGNIFEFTSWGVMEIVLSILIFTVGFILVFFLLKVLKNYTNKHKNYFNLEKTTLPLICLEEKNIERELKSKTDYEKKFIKDVRKDEGLIWLVVSVCCAFVLWCFNSFGG